MEAASAYVPVVVIASQIPSDMIGKRRGYVRELHDQRGRFEPIVKWSARSERVEQLPEVIAEAWRRALTPPSGPTYLEVPVDVLLAEAMMPRVDALDAKRPPPAAAPIGLLAEAAALLSAAERPVIWAGGGVTRSGGWEALVELAERIDAPVATTYMGEGGIAEDHPLAGGSAPHHPPLPQLPSAAAGGPFAGHHPVSAAARCSACLGYDDPRLLGGRALRGARTAAIPLSARVGDARIRLAGGARRPCSRAADGGARGRR